MCYKISLIVSLLAVGLLSRNSLSADVDPRLIEPPGSEHITHFEPSGIRKHLRFWPRNLPGQPEKDFDPNLYASFILERNSEPSWTRQEIEQGFVVCADHWQRPMFDLFRPSRGHLIKALSCSAAKAEYESIQLGVFALSDLSNVRMSVNLDLPFKAYRYVPVDHNLPVGEMVGGRYMVKKQDMKMPYFLFPEPQYRKVEKGKTYGFWITVRVPADARPGEHVGTVRITADNRKAFELPLKVMVRPFVLPKPKIAYGSYFDLHDRIKPEYHGVKFRRMYYEDMAAHGMNTAIQYSWKPWPDKKQGRYDPHSAASWLNWREGTWNEEGLIEEANLMKQAGLLDGGPLYILVSSWEHLPVAKIPRAVENLRRLQDKIGVEIIPSSWEEPVPPYGPKIKDIKPWHKAGMRFISSTGARPELEVLGPYNAAMSVNAAIVDYAAKQMLDKAGSEFWTYDCHNYGFAPMYARGYAGLFSWNAQVKGNMVWAYTHDRGVKDHYTIENGQVKVIRSRWFTRVCPGPKGPLPSIGWEARREGVDDYRYLQLLKEEAEAASADPKIVAEIRKWFQKQHDLLLWYQLSARYEIFRADGVFDVMDFFNPWPNITPEDYDQIREEAAAFIIRLTTGQDKEQDMSMDISQDLGAIQFSLKAKGLAEDVGPRRPVMALGPGRPLELELSAVNANDRSQAAKVTVRVLSLAGHEVWLQSLERRFPPGKTAITYKLFAKPGAPQEGQFLAQVLSAPDGKELAESVFGYFPAVPDIPETANAPGLILRDRKVVGKIPAERTGLTDVLPDYGRLDPILAQASDGELYVMFQETPGTRGPERGDTPAQRPTFIWSTDGGRSWQMRQVTLDPPAGNFEAVVAFGVVGDDQLFVAYCPLPDADRAEELIKEARRRNGVPPGETGPSWIEPYSKNTNLLALYVASSTDRGRTWSKSVKVDTSMYSRAHGLGRFHRGSDGAIWFNCGVLGPDKPGYIREPGRPYDVLFRSRDAGRTWGDATLMVASSAECQLLHLASGRWLTTIRTVDQPGDRMGPDGKVVNIFGLDKLPTYNKTAKLPWTGDRQWYLMHKRTFLAESEDGRDWGNFRQLTTIFGDTPGELIQLHDGRVVFLYCHRYGPQDGNYGRVSHDEGRTWGPELLALRNMASGYSSSTVLKDGTIVSILAGETNQVVRWRLPDDL